MPAGSSGTLPETVCPRTPPWNGEALGGSAGCWGESARLHLADCTQGTEPVSRTEVCVGHTREAFQCLFLCRDPCLWATRAGHDEPLWDEEAVGVFLDPFGDGRSYFELAVSPLNATLDLFARRTRTGIRRDPAWTCEGLETAAAIQAFGWAAALRIPFSGLGDCHPRVRPVWRVNFTRIDRLGEARRELSAWSPTGVGSFHVPERFGWLRFER